MNNKIIDIYANKSGQLILSIYNEITGKIEILKRDEDVEIYLNKLGQYPILETKEETRDSKEFDIIKYPGFTLQMHDIEHINDKIHHLKPLFDSLQNHFEKKKLAELGNVPSDKRKVQRTNKYPSKKLVAAVLVVGVLMGVVQTVSAINLNKHPETLVYGEQIALNVANFEHLESPIASEPMVSIDESEYFEANEIALEYEDLSYTDKALYAKEQYGDIIEKYSNRYGLDANLMLAIATQERGVHYTVMDKGGATGLMQIQNSVWLGNEISAYNFETGEYDKFVVNNNMLKDLETNIQLGCMVFQNVLQYVNYNIPMAIQTYNYGIGNMNKVIDAYANMNGQTKQEVISNQNDVGWLEYRDIINCGDKNYLNHVLSWMGEKVNISVMNKDSTSIELTISNNLQVNKTY